MLIARVDPSDLSQAGWGVVFDREEEPAVIEALRPLLEHRKAQAGGRYRELRHHAEDSAPEFRERYGMGPGPLDPEGMPFYLLLIGDPDVISFEFQYQLCVNHAVGRLHFEKVEDYARYAESVVAVEHQEPLLSRRAAFVSVQNPGGHATRIALTEFVDPLVADLQRRHPSWAMEMLTGPNASKASLQRLLGGDPAYALLFVSAHSYSLEPDNERQREVQGALVCQDWPGPRSGSPITEEHLLAADDVSAAADVKGSLIFFLSSNSAGTPRFEGFPRTLELGAEPRILAQRPFISRLAQRLLGHEAGGALAVVGHVDQAWTLSFRWDRGVRETAFRDVFERLLVGCTVGWAMRPLVHRFMDLATRLSELLYAQQASREPSHELISRLWRGQRDARNYIVLGDPAVRLSTQ
jgi:hypothetical protein